LLLIADWLVFGHLRGTLLDAIRVEDCLRSPGFECPNKFLSCFALAPPIGGRQTSELILVSGLELEVPPAEVPICVEAICEAAQHWKRFAAFFFHRFF